MIEKTEGSFESIAEKYSRSPGPVYDTGGAAEKTKRRNRQTLIGTESREKHFSLPTLSPGPVYNPNADKLSIYAQSPRATFGKAEKESGAMRAAGMSDVAVLLPPLEVTSPRSRRVFFGTSERGEKEKRGNPGPGEYEVSLERKKHTSTRGTFSSQARMSGAWIFK